MALKNLEITDLQARSLDMILRFPFSIASESVQVAHNALITVKLNNGIIGFGEAAPLPSLCGETQATVLASVEHARSAVVGQNPFRIRAISKNMHETLDAQRCALAAIEMAILDALTQSMEVPLYAYFGGEITKLRTDITLPVMKEVDKAKEFVTNFAAQGFNRFKIKLDGNIEQDLERVLVVREVAPKAEIQLDANQSYNPRDVMRLLKLLDKRSIVPILFEQPVPKDDWDGLCWITAHSEVPICADESVRDPSDALRVVKTKAADAVNIKLMKSGICGALDIIAICRSAHLRLMIGGMVESVLGMTMSAHIACGFGCFDYIDLDTPLFLQQTHFSGGFVQQGDCMTLEHIQAGIGVSSNRVAGVANSH